MNKDYPDFAELHTAWKSLSPGARAIVRRATTPDELLDFPVFYSLVKRFGWKAELKHWEKARWLRLVFLTDHVETNGEHSLGKALALSGKVSDKRLFQIVRSDGPLDIVQLRRVLKHVEPRVDWIKMARQIWDWDRCQKRSLMEDFVLNQHD